MESQTDDARLAKLAAAIAEPARSRILCRLLDGRARTSTELAVVAGVSPSTASVHLGRLKERQLVKTLAQGKHRYYSLASAEVARALEVLMAVAGGSGKAFVPTTPGRLQIARTCYDHVAGGVAVALHDRLMTSGWLSSRPADGEAYDVTARGADKLETLGIDIDATRALRRRFAYPCLDWSERRPHIGGGLGAALLKMAFRRKWLVQDLDSRALRITRSGRHELQVRFGVRV